MASISPPRLVGRCCILRSSLPPVQNSGISFSLPANRWVSLERIYLGGWRPRQRDRRQAIRNRLLKLLCRYVAKRILCSKSWWAFSRTSSAVPRRVAQPRGSAQPFWLDYGVGDAPELPAEGAGGIPGLPVGATGRPSCAEANLQGHAARRQSSGQEASRHNPPSRASRLSPPCGMAMILLPPRMAHRRGVRSARNPEWREAE
jgi:hypothetical protein